MLCYFSIHFLVYKLSLISEDCIPDRVLINDSVWENQSVNFEYNAFPPLNHGAGLCFIFVTW